MESGPNASGSLTIWTPSYLLTPWCRVLLEQLTGLQLVKKFPAFHGTRRFITALTSVRHLSLSWASPIQSIYPYPTSWRSILLLSTHLRLGLPSGLFPSGFLTKTLYTPLSSPIRATCPAYLIRTLTTDSKIMYTNTKKAGHNWYQTDKKSVSEHKKKNDSYFIFKTRLDFQLNIKQTSKKSLLYTTKWRNTTFSFLTRDLRDSLLFQTLYSRSDHPQRRKTFQFPLKVTALGEMESALKYWNGYTMPYHIHLKLTCLWLKRTRGRKPQEKTPT